MSGVAVGWSVGSDNHKAPDKIHGKWQTKQVKEVMQEALINQQKGITVSGAAHNLHTCTHTLCTRVICKFQHICHFVVSSTCDGRLLYNVRAGFKSQHLALITTLQQSDNSSFTEALVDNLMLFHSTVLALLFFLLIFLGGSEGTDVKRSTGEQ